MRGREGGKIGNSTGEWWSCCYYNYGSKEMII